MGNFLISPSSPKRSFHLCSQAGEALVMNVRVRFRSRRQLQIRHNLAHDPLVHELPHYDMSLINLANAENEFAASVTSPVITFIKHILRRSAFVPSFTADYWGYARRCKESKPSESRTLWPESVDATLHQRIRMAFSTFLYVVLATASRTRLWLLSGWGCRGRRLSRG